MKHILRRAYRVLPLFLLCWLLAAGAFAQDRKITGRITDGSDNSGLPGANVVIKGTQIGMVTDAQGRFSLNVAPGRDVLTVSAIGYVAQEIAIGNRTEINVVLAADIKTLSEVIVTGYGAQAKRDITGAVATVDTKQLLSIPATNVGQALQGRVAGVTVGNENAPGGGVMVRIRGFGTINDNSPLYVIDGVPTKGNLNTLNLGDIESLQVLKDASAASIYGSRAGNGVVIITTKKGKAGKPKFTYDTYYGSQGHGKLLDMLNTNEYAQLIWESRKNSGVVSANGNPNHSQFGNGATPTIPDFILPSGVSASDPRVAQDANGNYINYNNDISSPKFLLITKANKEGTNWMEEIFQTAPMQNHQLGVSGGNEGGRYALSLNYFDQQGIMKHTGYKRYSLRSNTEFNVTKKIRVGQNFQAAYGERIGQPSGNGTESNPISFAYRIQPIIPVYDVAGNFAGTRGGDLDNAFNPMADLYRNKDNVQKEVRLFGNAFAEVDVLPNLTARTSFGIDYNLSNYRNYSIRNIEASEARGSNSLQTNNSYDWTWTWYNTLTYNINLGERHRFNVIAGTESIKSYFEFFDASRTSFAVDDIENRYLSAGTGVQTNNGGASNWRLASEFAKLNYGLDDKYLIDLTVRRDRSSRFAKEFRSAVFPAASVGWRLSKEAFMRPLTFIDDFKIRAGYGQTGNQEIGNYNSFTQFSTNPITSFYDINGTRTSAVPGYELTQFGNAKAKWETTTSLNIGFDASLLKNRLSVAFDWYTRTTSDMLFPVSAPLTQGVAVNPFQNIGTMRNRGVDLMINYGDKIGSSGLTYNVGANFSTYRNVVTKTTGDPNTQYFGINDERIQNFVVTQQGFPISSFYGYTIDGIFQTNEEAKAYPVQFGNATSENVAGRFKFRDINGDGVINSKDQSIIGNPHPSFNYGVNLSLNYKGFGLTVFGQGVQGNQIFNYTKYWTDFPTFAGNRSTRMLYQSWRPGSIDAILPQLRSSDQVSIQPSTYYLESGSYFRLKNVQLTYQLPQALLSRLRMGATSVYVQGQNLLTSTKYSGLDPEINLRNYSAGNDRQIGVDGGSYPVAKTILVGLNLSF
ncbi:SusC/RagA family TonB-linked outer membrane protein [Spirosoma utsteinense]|uniref:TonB-linked SusC/RagA family outer membrane protein n=1 Tax=Spirosoma utsteinense TaxID=2585773 RepID=A0ABR6W804_9BACT|nr:TonB-dependent receptor [Spirosoma utsteinense]MBC3787683.1 TonB-linked SusC/RagA family outer membrane protein [Spirosoma utsteinense]MBC3792714.1 TonB-linked SusC/RagA family outer membrane protein [Spirosoma utsteinense]